jgi:hypothetical protein
MLSSTAFANSLANVISGHLNEANDLVDTFLKSTDDGDALLARIQDATDAKNPAAYQDIRTLTDAINKRFKDNGTALVKLMLIKDADCALALADTSKSDESQNAIDVCNELRSALEAAAEARGVTAQGLDAIKNALSIYVTVLEELDAAAAKAQEEKDAAEAKAQIEAERVAAELKAKQDADAAAAKAAAAKAAAAKAAALKKTTITCVKGKLTKKVTAVKPVCPAGYKKK